MKKTSRFKGVSLVKKTGRYLSQIHRGHINVTLGSYVDEFNAFVVRERAVYYYKKHGRLNTAAVMVGYTYKRPGRPARLDWSENEIVATIKCNGCTLKQSYEGCRCGVECNSEKKYVECLDMVIKQIPRWKGWECV